VDGPLGLSTVLHGSASSWLSGKRALGTGSDTRLFEKSARAGSVYGACGFFPWQPCDSAPSAKGIGHGIMSRRRLLGAYSKHTIP
jgi:hypothetical protein